MYTLRHKITGHVPIGCNDAPDLDYLAYNFVCYQLKYEERARHASTDEIISEAYLMGYEVFEDKKAVLKMERMRNLLADDPSIVIVVKGGVVIAVYGLGLGSTNNNKYVTIDWDTLDFESKPLVEDFIMDGFIDTTDEAIELTK